MTSTPDTITALIAMAQRHGLPLTTAAELRRQMIFQATLRNYFGGGE